MKVRSPLISAEFMALAEILKCLSMAKDSPRNFRYRYDLDGLRGIAIALVVIFHVFVGRVSGGVDVFLLLSGYFFLGSQLRYAGKNNASLNPWWPIWRTIRRLVPALALVIGVTFLLVYFVTPQLLRQELTQQITATLLYYQNWELAAQDADYAAASAETSPLQHMWSMAVQGQFYLMGILFATLLAAVMKLRPSSPAKKFPTVNQIAGPLLIVATIASFAYASRHGLYGTGDNYYSTWSRAWELTLGAVLAIYAHKVPTLSRRLSDALTALGLLALILTGVLISNSLAFPGPLSLLPLGGAMLIILFGGGRISGVMASKKARWLGDVAYSLYLWHWPLLILSTSALGVDTPPWWLGVIIIVISLILAQLTHKFIEQPLRQHRKRPMADDMPVHKGWSDMRTRAGGLRAFGGVIVAACVAAMMSIQPWWNSVVANETDTNLNTTFYPGVMANFGANVPSGMPVKPDPVLVGSMMPPFAQKYCFVGKDRPGDELNEFSPLDPTVPCAIGDLDADFTVYMVGGSHSEQWAAGFEKLGNDMGFKVVPMLRQDCPIETGPGADVTPVCAEWGQMVIDRIIEDKPDLVVSNTTRPGGERGTGLDYVPAGYVGFWEVLAENNIPFLGLRDNPWGIDEDGQGYEFDECYVATEDAAGCGRERETFYQPVDPSAAILAQWPNMIAVDTQDWFCGPDDNCPVVMGNTMVYRDMHHITNAFAVSAAPLLREYVQPFFDRVPQQQEVPENLHLNEQPVESWASKYQSQLEKLWLDYNASQVDPDTGQLVGGQPIDPAYPDPSGQEILPPVPRAGGITAIPQ